jgi:hypothetical protein
MDETLSNRSQGLVLSRIKADALQDVDQSNKADDHVIGFYL